MRKRYIILVFISMASFGQTSIESKYQMLVEEFNNKMKVISKIQYDVQNKRTFSDGTVWDKSGSAIIDKKESDTIFGFSYYAFQKDMNSGTIYENYKSYIIDFSKTKYEDYNGDRSTLGSPGGQMIYDDIFQLEQSFDSLEMHQVDKKIIIDYFSKNNSYHKKLILDKNSLLPISVKTKRIFRGSEYVVQYDFSNLRINDKVEVSVKQKLHELGDFGLIPKEILEPSQLLNKQLPVIILQNLFSLQKTTLEPNQKIMLLDFWEYWCGWCIKSLPEIERIHNTYKEYLIVYGIAKDKPEIAKKRVKQENLTFTNLIGTDALHDQFSVESFPRYFLIDKNGIVRKEYFEYNKQIERDIKKLIKE